MDHSSGYVSNNSASMNALPPAQYATVGRRKPGGGVKRTSSLSVPHPPAPPRANPIPKPKRSYAAAKASKLYKSDQGYRPSSRASKSSLHSGSGVMRRPSSREPANGKSTPRRAGSRASHSKVRRPDSRASSKALIMRRRESMRGSRPPGSGGRATSSAGRSVDSSEGGSRGGGRRPRSRGGSSAGTSPTRGKRTTQSTAKSFFWWRPKVKVKRSKSMATAKPAPPPPREIRFGDVDQPGVMMMRGVEHRRAGEVISPHLTEAQRSQTLPRPPRTTTASADVWRRGPSAERQLDRPPARVASESPDRRRRLLESASGAGGSPRRERLPRDRSHSPQRSHSPLRPTRSSSPFKGDRERSEMSSSPAPRPPMWRAASDGSISETMTNLSALSANQQQQRPAGNRHQQRPRQKSPGKSSTVDHKPSVIDFIRRKLSMKPREKPKRPVVQPRDDLKRAPGAPRGEPRRMPPGRNGPLPEGQETLQRRRAISREDLASSSSPSWPDRPPRGRMQAAKSHDALVDVGRTAPDPNSYSSLPRGKHRSGSTALSRRISNMGNWNTLGRTPAGRPPTNGYISNGTGEVCPDRTPSEEGVPRIPAKTPDRYLPRQNSVNPAGEEPIQPILQDRRELSRSQPALYHPAGGEPAGAGAEEPFTVYANLPFLLPARRGPEQPAAQLSALKAKRAMSQPSLLAPKPDEESLPSSADRSSPMYAAYRADQYRQEELMREDQRAARQQRLPPPPAIDLPLPPGGGPPPPARPPPATRTVWKPSISLKPNGILKRRGDPKGPPLGQKGTSQLDLRPQRQQKGTSQLDLRPQRQQGVLRGIARNITNVFKHRKPDGEVQRVPDGYQAIPGSAVVSERFTNVTNTHEERDNVREEEEVHQLGDYSNEEVSRAVRDGNDARSLIRQRESSGRSGQLVPAGGQRRLVHQSGNTWRTVDTDDTHEKTHRDEHGELITETARTKQQEQFNEMLVPDDNSGLRDGEVQEQQRSSSHRRRHTRDVDELEYYSIPKGGRLGDGIKLGDGLRYVQENVEGAREGSENIESLSERMRKMRQLGITPGGGTQLAKTAIEYQEEEKTKRKETEKWLESNFVRNDSSEEEGRGGEPRREQAEWQRDTRSYQYEKNSSSSGRRAEPYKQVRDSRDTPDHAYRSDSPPRRGPRVSSRGPDSIATTEMDDDPVLSSKYSSGLTNRVRSGQHGVRFHSPERGRWPESGRLSPPTQSPPPPPPPRHRTKNGRGGKGSSHDPPPDNHYASSPIRERYQRDLTPNQSQRYRSEIQQSYRSGSPPRRDSRGGSRTEYDRREYHDDRRGSYSTDSYDGRRRNGEPQQRGPPRRVHYGSSEQLDRHVSEERHQQRTATLASDDPRSQTLPRQPRPLPGTSPLAAPPPDSSRLGGSMINVSTKREIRSSAPMKPQRLGTTSVQRSSSLYSADGLPANDAYSVGLKSPDIISKIQRTASLKRDADGGPEQYRSPSMTSSSSHPRSPGRDGSKDSFLRGLQQTSPELYNALERGDGQMTPPPPLQPARSPNAGGRAHATRTQQVRQTTTDSRHGSRSSQSRSYTPSDQDGGSSSYRTQPSSSYVKVTVPPSIPPAVLPITASVSRIGGAATDGSSRPANPPPSSRYRYSDEEEERYGSSRRVNGTNGDHLRPAYSRVRGRERRELSPHEEHGPVCIQIRDWRPR